MKPWTRFGKVLEFTLIPRENNDLIFLDFLNKIRNLTVFYPSFQYAFIIITNTLNNFIFVYLWLTLHIINNQVSN